MNSSENKNFRGLKFVLLTHILYLPVSKIYIPNHLLYIRNTTTAFSKWHKGSFILGWVLARQCKPSLVIYCRQSMVVSTSIISVIMVPLNGIFLIGTFEWCISEWYISEWYLWMVYFWMVYFWFLDMFHLLIVLVTTFLWQPCWMELQLWMLHFCWSVR